MLQKLSIQNYALIDKLEFSPSAQFTAITGETGAGKSIILGALQLLTGARADVKTLLDETKKCVIEANFNIEKLALKPFFEENELDYDQNTIIRREISPQGKSRAFINDSPVNLETLSQLTDSLIDIHSQHDNLLISTSGFQLNCIDAYAENETLKNNYFESYITFKKSVKELEKLKLDESISKKEYDYDKFIFDELVQFNFQDGEQELLESEISILENADEIKQKLLSSISIIDQSETSILFGLQTVYSQINQLGKLSSKFEEFKHRIQAIITETKDINQELIKLEEKTEVDPERMSKVRERLDGMYKIFKKHAVISISDLLLIQNNLKEKTSYFGSLSEKIAQAESDLKIKESDLKNKGILLSESRKKYFTEIKNQITSFIQVLGMPNGTLEIECLPLPYSDTGIDKISMLFSANKGLAPSPIKNASGGELSRLMFALKYMLAQKTALPTMVFDEIDTGISGDIAIKMAEMMRNIAQKQQIITITHLHQIAAKGHAHFFVYKNDDNKTTQSNIKLLDNNERLTKIAEMIGGNNPSASALESAKEFLN